MKLVIDQTPDLNLTVSHPATTVEYSFTFSPPECRKWLTPSFSITKEDFLSFDNHTMKTIFTSTDVQLAANKDGYPVKITGIVCPLMGSCIKSTMTY